jgi:hypothetical protein
MNMRVAVPSLRGPYPVPAPARKTRDCSRADILEQIVVGILWMSMDLPEDASRQELENLAHHLVTQIRTGTAETAIATELALLQAEQFCGRSNEAAIRSVVGRVVHIVRGS